MQPFPQSNDATHKNWSRLAWDIKVEKCEIFVIQGQVKFPKMNGLIRLKIKLNQAFMPVLVTSNFDDD